MTNPWWYSGGDDADEPRGVEDDPSRPEFPTFDPATLVTAANQLVEWATEKFVAPHAEHVNPADHPTCVLCRGAAVLGTVGRPDTPASASVAPMTWVPVRRIAE